MTLQSICSLSLPAFAEAAPQLASVPYRENPSEDRQHPMGRPSWWSGQQLVRRPAPSCGHTCRPSAVQPRRLPMALRQHPVLRPLAESGTPHRQHPQTLPASQPMAKSLPWPCPTALWLQPPAPSTAPAMRRSQAAALAATALAETRRATKMPPAALRTTATANM